MDWTYKQFGQPKDSSLIDGPNLRPNLEKNKGHFHKHSSHAETISIFVRADLWPKLEKKGPASVDGSQVGPMRFPITELSGVDFNDR